MAGYTPVFDTVFNGTLCGKWPELPVWLTLLPLADWQGHIDLTPEAIAARTGWPLDLLLKGIEILCQPDERSRSKAEEGRRLVPIDSDRPWGWRVVNIQKYRDKASDANQVSDGRNAAKVRKYKARHRRTPADTAGHRSTLKDTDSYSNTDSDKEKNVGTSSLCSETTRQSSSFFSEPDDLQKSLGEGRGVALTNSVRELAQRRRVPR